MTRPSERRCPPLSAPAHPPLDPRMSALSATCMRERGILAKRDPLPTRTGSPRTADECFLAVTRARQNLKASVDFTSSIVTYVRMPAIPGSAASPSSKNCRYASMSGTRILMR